ncbi:hypothetical protein E3N88_06390 [Mikania micrantha]|uniref:SHSP domain-containing protein n=1 Tax=Mikania micrantha TaxID=192012 RepID=A0A5N6PNK9_9ASTR|nr:hypothetical protein E3N88_06390 [Mikania micrantha]
MCHGGCVLCSQKSESGHLRSTSNQTGGSWSDDVVKEENHARHQIAGDWLNQTVKIEQVEDNVKVKVEDENVLVISGERKREHDQEKKEGVKYVSPEAVCGGGC